MHVLCMYVCTCTNLVLEEIRCKKQEARSLMKFLGRMTYETIAQARFPRLAHHLFRVRDQSTTLPHPSNYYSIAIASLCGMKRHCINQAVTDHPRCGTCWKEGGRKGRQRCYDVLRPRQTPPMFQQKYISVAALDKSL